MDIVKSLDELAEIKAALDVTRLDYEAKRAVILAQVKDQLDALDIEFIPGISVASQRATELDAEIRSAVIAGGASVKAAHLHAVYSKGRTTWDGKKLDGMMSLIPQLADARKVGEPSVTIRTIA